ncbi:MAG: cytochrome C [Candidatus Rokuibacteriota bacterium]|nr:MAG: cytochrome C [Candidatus Rokubacteria bacterium]
MAGHRGSRVRRFVTLGVGTTGALLLAIQAVPYGHRHENPPVRLEPRWAGSATRDLAVRACYDCHSNETAWPWYSYVAPMSWLIRKDIDEGRGDLNFSEWNRAQPEAEKTAEVVQKGEMPPRYYVLLHSDARLSPADRRELIQGLEATMAARLPGVQ